MIDTKAIVDSANRELLTAFPEFFFYTDFTEKEFKRPAFLLLADRKGAAGKKTRRVSEFVLYMTIVYYAQTDAYYRADKTGLRDVSDKVTDIFAKEYMLVGDRAVRVRVSDGGIREREAYLDLEIRYTEESGTAGRGSAAEEDCAETMRKLYTSMK